MFKAALIQSSVFKHKKDTLAHVSSLIQQASKSGAQLALLSQCFNTFYNKSYLTQNAQDFSNSQTLDFLSNVASKNKMILAGSIPQKQGDSLFNSGFVLSQEGKLLAKYRKMHLFDIDIPGKITYFQSKIFNPGNKITVVQTSVCKLGIGICYDLRFPQLALLMADSGAEFLFYPSLFSMATGPLHFQLLLRARAVDTFSFVAGVSARRAVQLKDQVYQSWAHSTIINPSGKVLGQLDEKEGMLIVQVDVNEVREQRRNIPVLMQRRKQVYELKAL